METEAHITTQILGQEMQTVPVYDKSVYFIIQLEDFDIVVV